MIKNRGGNAACFSYIHICRIKIIHAVLDESLPQYVAFFSVVLLQADTLLSATVFLSIRKLFPPIPQKKEPGDGSIYREKEESHGCKQEWMKIKNSLITQSTSKRDLPTNPLYTNQYERGTQKTDNVCWFSPILLKTFGICSHFCHIFICRIDESTCWFPAYSPFWVFQGLRHTSDNSRIGTCHHGQCNIHGRPSSTWFLHHAACYFSCSFFPFVPCCCRVSWFLL